MDLEVVMIKKYRKLPVEIEAVQFTGVNYRMIAVWSDDHVYIRGIKLPAPIRELEITVDTLEGKVRARVGDYIIKGVRGEFYPCEKSIFEETYIEANKNEIITLIDSSGMVHKGTEEEIKKINREIDLDKAI